MKGFSKIIFCNIFLKIFCKFKIFLYYFRSQKSFIFTNPVGVDYQLLSTALIEYALLSFFLILKINIKKLQRKIALILICR